MAGGIMLPCLVKIQNNEEGSPCRGETATAYCAMVEFSPSFLARNE
jgi:hypothetical protein